MGQAAFDDLLRLRIMVGVAAFDERDGLRQRSNVTLQNALHILLGRETVFLLTNEIRVDDRLIGDAFRYGKGRIVMMVDILFFVVIYFRETHVILKV